VGQLVIRDKIEQKKINDNMFASGAEEMEVFSLLSCGNEIFQQIGHKIQKGNATR
jgi:hypothetical protein